jgi:hypothetical protein
MLAAIDFSGPARRLTETPFRSGAMETLALGIVVTRDFCKKVTLTLFAIAECKKAPENG